MDHPTPSAVDTGPAANLAARVDAELTRRLHEQDLPGIITNYCAAALVAWLHWNTGSRATLFAWVLVWCVANTVYLGFYGVHRRVDRERLGSTGWRWSHLLISNVLSVSPAGFMPWLFSPTPELLYLNTTLVFIYFAGIYASNAMISPPSYFFAGGTVIAPLVALHVGLGSTGSLAIAAAALLFYVALVPFANVQAGALRQAIRVGYENEELARRLARQTERAEEARRDAEEANRAKARFLAAATHDLRQPLHALALTLETLPQGTAGAPGQSHVDRARECTRQLSSMFDALLDQAQLDAGTRPVVAEPVALAELFDQIEGQFQAQAQDRRLWLRCRPTTGVVRTDALALWRIASNLVTNALAATERGGVLVAWRSHSRTLEVRDSGRGIATADHEAVFREFHRLPGPSSQRDRGLGLGLATVKRLAQLQNARVVLRSAPGRGSVFGITFPPEAILAAGSARAADRPDDRPAADWDPQGCRVLAVDDDPAILAALDDLLRTWGFEVRLAGSASEAAARLDDRWEPRVLMLDRHLPDGDRLSLAATLRARCATPPACLIVTGDTAPDDLRAVVGSGLEVLYKPVAPARLREALQRLGV
jgi:signal transduction histidine kinase/CheY-like chemotaxis protein